MSLKSAVGRARGLGSAKEGAGHFWAQRVSAVFLIPLSLWFVTAVIGLSHADYASVKTWFAKPCNASLMIMTVLTVLYHAQLGLQMVIEDYVHCELKKLVSLIAVKFVLVFLAIVTTVSVLKVAVGV